ncbi:sensor domain-containing diguanylate cyclase [Paenibacillus odorifer]|uniref:GGDEF domain-containing protein n=1 Tax=Paenibacillus odorifer TaxID=189426 RepID=A0A1R0X1A6_9BACL|nr:sensor domain-containing diguanylate cyclase [Paenibacillus odorifer]OMC94492.1 GGDEF domain-containing protein [Paenibacillus odorifer]OMD08645.1 GGDEF domain-containing protein [Paenibacillus odorifer]OMD13388.1 GGDEF domain-containing protein [Paenibacillus odorifer]OMD24820.1 GGDEF domain-containing protein [Paenibacillus odorifer]OMD26404.1 GGDEF domain-containing protein [Paenibacillus odorifer]
MSEQKAYAYKDSRMLIQDKLHASRDSEDPTAWLRETEIVSHDFPYLANLIADSFEEWIDGLEALPFAKSWDWCVLNFEGRYFANIADQQERWRHQWEQAAAASLLSGTTSSVQLTVQGQDMSFFTIPLITRVDKEIFAFLGCAMPTQQYLMGGRDTAEAISLQYRTIFYHKFEHIFVTDLASVHLHAERESNRRSLLFQIVQRMHDNIDVNAVLTEVIDSISAMYPGARLELFMSQDHRSTHPQVKPLPFQMSSDDVCARAFKDGRVALNTNTEDQHIVEIGLPLGGKQGVYGVFHMVMDNSIFMDVDLRFLSMVADTAGTAFENAKLYERSNQLIRELRMSNELTQRLNQSLRLGDIFQFAFEELLEMFGADYCCILHMNEEKGGLEVIACNHSSLQNEILEVGQGLGGKVYTTGESLIMSNYIDNPNTTSRLMNATGSQSLIATPLSVGGEVRGAIMLAHRDAHYFSYDNYRLLQAMAGHIGLAVGNARLHAEVRRLANRDSLTGLYARHYLDEEIKERQSTDFCGCLIVVDIDQFKMVNDTYGHQKGDKILKEVSEIVKSSIRQGDIAARWGGEELSVYLPLMGVEQAVNVAERIRKRVMNETEPNVTVSCGIAEWSWMDERVSVESLFYRADMALYKAKNNGRNQVIVDTKENGSGVKGLPHK